jgi:HNH endonuclease
MRDGGPSKTACHRRARALKAAVDRCEWAALGHCLGPLDVAHLDGDPANNDPANLRRLCRSHHALTDRGRIDPAAPAQPGYRTSRGGGKRRYLPAAIAGQGRLPVAA